MVPAGEIDSSAVCPKCEREYPIHPSAESVTEALLAAILAEQREQYRTVRAIRTELFALRILIGILMLFVVVFGVRVSFK